MNQNIFSCGLCIAVILVVSQSFGIGISDVDYGDLPGRVYTNYEGKYTFSCASVISVEGLEDLHVLKYKCSNCEGVVALFARVTDDGRVLLLHECGPNTKGVSPVLEGIDAFPGEDEAEVIVRWRHPGNGGLRTVQKYRCTSEEMNLLDSADYRDKRGGEKGLRWISSTAFAQEAKQFITRPCRVEPGPSPP